MADGVAIERRGKPAVTLVGAEFLRGAAMKRAALGMADLALQKIMIPNSEAQARDEAARIAGAVVAALVGESSS